MTVLPNSPHARDIKNVLHPYSNLVKHEEKGPLILDEGEGIYVKDTEGKSYIEGLAGLWCTSLGFNNERLVEAAANQMRKLPYYHAFFHRSSMPAIDLAEMLIDMAPAPMSKVWFANSGSEANDHMVKFVWYYNNALGRPEKKKIIARIGGYHGIAVSSGSLTGMPLMHAGFDLPIHNIMHTGSPHYYRFGEDGESEEDFATRRANELDQMIQDEGAGDGRGLCGRADHGRRRRHPAAQDLFREDPGGLEEARRADGGRRGHLRLPPHRQPVRLQHL